MESRCHSLFTASSATSYGGVSEHVVCHPADECHRWSDVQRFVVRCSLLRPDVWTWLSVQPLLSFGWWQLWHLVIHWGQVRSDWLGSGGQLGHEVEPGRWTGEWDPWRMVILPFLFTRRFVLRHPLRCRECNQQLHSAVALDDVEDPFPCIVFDIGSAVRRRSGCMAVWPCNLPSFRLCLLRVISLVEVPPNRCDAVRAVMHVVDIQYICFRSESDQLNIVTLWEVNKLNTFFFIVIVEIWRWVTSSLLGLKRTKMAYHAVFWYSYSKVCVMNFLII